MKLYIKETQIDNYNETTNQFIKYDEGLNIICGNNEAGKSTLMNFIKNIFMKKSDAKGYVKCNFDGEDFNLRAEKKSKENEQYLKNISSNNYKTGFIIDIDDIMFAKKADSETLINTIKDSSGNYINSKQEEYYNYIYKKSPIPLTGKNEASKNFKDKFNEIKTIDSEIKHLEQQEEEYNNICSKINETEKQLQIISDKINCGEILLQEQNITNEIKQIKINKKLLSNKANFDKLREEYGALNFEKQKTTQINNAIETYSLLYKEKLKELNTIEPFTEDSINIFDTSVENLKLANTLKEEEKSILTEQNIIQNNIDNLNKNIDDINIEIETLTNSIADFKIIDISEYKNDRDLLENYKTNYSEIMSKALSYGNKNIDTEKFFTIMFFLIFGGLLMASIGVLILSFNTAFKLYSEIFLAISISGLLTTLIKFMSSRKNSPQKSFTKELNKLAKEIINLLNKHGYIISKDNDFMVQTGLYIQKMNDKISEYTIVENDLLKTKIQLQKTQQELETQKDKQKDIYQKYEKLTQNKTEFLTKFDVKNIENFNEIFDIIKELKESQNNQFKLNEDLKNIDKKTESFVKNLNEFITNSELETIQNLNKYDYDEFEKTLSEIRTLIDETISNDKILAEYNNKIADYQTELEKYSETTKNSLLEINPETILILKEKQEELKEEKIRLTQTKENLERVGSLVDIKNDKNIKINQLKEQLKTLIKKEVIYNLIQKAKEKFNETQPNLVCAKEYLNKITCGKYNEINFETGTISGNEIGDKDWDCLSRGTKEQLYLALRLGYANNFSKNIDGTPNGLPDMPLIIDDAFVNFDPNRTAAILKCLKEFSKNNQVLYFTCHTNSTKELLKKEKIKHSYIEI